MNNPLSRVAASPFSHAARGKGDDASAAGRPLRGVCWSGPRQFHGPLAALGSVGG